MKFIVILSLLLLFPFTGQTADTFSEIHGTDVVTQKKWVFQFPSMTKATVLIFVSAKCPCSASHESLLKDLHAQFKDVTFIGIHSNTDETPTETSPHFKETNFPFPVLQDEKSFLANKLGALKTPHAFVLNQKGDVLYRGGVTDSHVGPSAQKQFLKEVLEDIEAGKTPRHKEGRALGCYIQREDD